jgi:hypothetical protein
MKTYQVLNNGQELRLIKSSYKVKGEWKDAVEGARRWLIKQCGQTLTDALIAADVKEVDYLKIDYTSYNDILEIKLIK